MSDSYDGNIQYAPFHDEWEEHPIVDWGPLVVVLAIPACLILAGLAAIVMGVF